MSPAPRPRRRALRALLALALAPVALWCAAWTIGRHAWPLDLLGNLAAQGAVAAILLAALAALARAWAVAAAAVACAALALAPLPGGRAPRADAPDPARTVSLLTVNAYADNPTPRAVRDLVLAAGADVVFLYEAPTELLDIIRAEPDIRAVYPHFDLPDAARTGFPLVLSRWPQTPVPTGRDPAKRGMDQHGRVYRIDHPSVPFIASMIYPESPRTPARWRNGNAAFAEAARAANDVLAPLGVPVLLVGDMNTTPSGRRHRMLVQRSDLRRAKPFLAPVGTFPARLPWPLRIAIDDAYVSPGVRIVSWETLPPVGSDHLHVLIRAELPSPPAPAPAPR